MEASLDQSQLTPSNFCMTYYQALEHMSSCDYKPVKCPLECGASVPQTEMQNHIKNNCENLLIRCSKCDLKVKAKKYERGEHDCFSELKARVKELENQKAEQTDKGRILKELNFQTHSEQPKCTRGHKMKYWRGNPYRAGRVVCDSCPGPRKERQAIEGHDFFFHCESCKEDMCQACNLIQLNELVLQFFAQKVKCHPHPLIKNRDRGNWICDGTDMSSGC